MSAEWSINSLAWLWRPSSVTSNHTSVACVVCVQALSLHLFHLPEEAFAAFLPSEFLFILQDPGFSEEQPMLLTTALAPLLYLFKSSYIWDISYILYNSPI